MSDSSAQSWKTVELGTVARVATVFLPAAAIGTLGHELGHFGVAWWLGCAPTLHFASVSPGCVAGAVDPSLRMWGVAAGPISSMVTGSIGMVLLARWRQQHTRLDVLGAVCTIVPLFWSRPLFNLLIHLGALATGQATLDALSRSDEARLSLYFGWPLFAVGIGTAALSLMVCAWTTAMVPGPDRLGWLVGAASGSLVGFAVWMAVLGPAWLP